MDPDPNTQSGRSDFGSKVSILGFMGPRASTSLRTPVTYLDPAPLPADSARPVRESVAVAGSCLTRDNFNGRFNPEWRKYFEVVANANQSSIISLMSPPIDTPIEPLRPMQTYDLWNIHSDLAKEFLPALADARPSLLVLDFQADVRFGVAQLPDGRYFTDHHWKTRQTDFYARLDRARELRFLRPFEDPDSYFDLWVEALDRFATYVAEVSPLTKVVVHRGHHARRILVPRRPRPVPLHGQERLPHVDPDAADAWWARLDDHAVDVHGWEQIDLRDVAAPTHTRHPWGPGFLHFTSDYHHRFLAELNKVSLRSRLDEDAMHRLEQVERAAVRPWERRLAEEVGVAEARRRRLRALRRQLAELQGQQESGVSRVRRRLRQLPLIRWAFFG
jgi:hypothetical protein